MNASSRDRVIDWLIQHPRVLLGIYVAVWLAGAALLTLAHYSR